MRPLLLDLFCCAGGAARGYDAAGFDVIGVDLDAQPHYPYTFIQADALIVLDALLHGYSTNDARLRNQIDGRGYKLEDIDAFHASPPCQRFAALVNCRPGVAETYPDLIGPTRSRLKATGKPYVIENVMGAPLDHGAAILCGTQFGKRFQLHRLFEANFPIPQPTCHHGIKPFNIENAAGRKKMREEFGQDANLWRMFFEEKGVYDFTPYKKERREAISPYYSQYVGRFIRHELARRGEIMVGEAA